jgi:hypothetical protein
MYSADHPDTAQDYQRLKQIQRGGKQAIETTAMNAMWDAIEEGRSREEAEKIYFSFFNKKSHE